MADVLKIISPSMIKQVEDKSKTKVEQFLIETPKMPTKSGWMPIYEIEHILSLPQQGVTLSFSDGLAPVCSKTVDSATLASYMPTLNCDAIYVTYNSDTKEILYMCGLSKLSKP
jgi:hypothetical protein